MCFEYDSAIFYVSKTLAKVTRVIAKNMGQSLYVKQFSFSISYIFFYSYILNKTSLGGLDP